MSDKVKLRVNWENILQKVSNLVTSWGSTPSDSKYPSEKLVKDSLDGKQDTLVSGTSIKTVNNNSLLGSGNISIQGGSGGSNITDYYYDTTNNEMVLEYDSGVTQADIVTSWSSTTSDTNVPSEKLTKNSLDDKISKSSTVGLVKNDGSIDTSTYLTTHQSLSNYIEKNNTAGLIKNDGTVMTSGTGSSNWAIGNHTHSAYVNPTIADNLTTNDASQVLSAKQGKVLDEKIGNIISIINGTGS